MPSSASVGVGVTTRRVTGGVVVAVGVTVTGAQANGATGTGAGEGVRTVLLRGGVEDWESGAETEGVCTGATEATALVSGAIGTADGTPDGTVKPTLLTANATAPTTTQAANHWRPPIGEGAETADGRGRRWRPREDRWAATPT